MLDATVSRNFFERQLIQLLVIIEHQQRLKTTKIENVKMISSTFKMIFTGKYLFILIIKCLLINNDRQQVHLK